MGRAWQAIHRLFVQNLFHPANTRREGLPFMTVTFLQNVLNVTLLSGGWMLGIDSIQGIDSGEINKNNPCRISDAAVGGY
jgi:hypothetical protein